MWTVPMMCDCSVYPIVLGRKYGRCGRCRKHPTAIFDMEVLVMLRNAGYEVRVVETDSR